MEQNIRKQALNQIFGNLGKSGNGNHKTKKSGAGEDTTGEFRNYNFGDPVEKISITESLKNAQINNGIGDFFGFRLATLGQFRLFHGGDQEIQCRRVVPDDAKLFPLLRVVQVHQYQHFHAVTLACSKCGLAR